MEGWRKGGRLTIYWKFDLSTCTCRCTLASAKFCKMPGMKDLLNLTQTEPIAVANVEMMLAVVMI